MQSKAEPELSRLRQLKSLILCKRSHYLEDCYLNSRTVEDISQLIGLEELNLRKNVLTIQIVTLLERLLVVWLTLKISPYWTSVSSILMEETAVSQTIN